MFNLDGPSIENDGWRFPLVCLWWAGLFLVCWIWVVPSRAIYEWWHKRRSK